MYPKRENNFKLFFTICQIIGIGAVILVITWVAHFRKGIPFEEYSMSNFNWHPVLMTLGMIYLQGTAILSFRYFKDMKKKNCKIIHVVAQAVAVILSTFGMFTALRLHPGVHLYTLHSWIGVIAFIIYVSQWIFGLVTYMYPGLSLGFRASFLPTHVFIGLLSLGLSTASAIIGFDAKAIYALDFNYTKLPVQAVIINTIGVLSTVFACLVIYIVANPNFKRRNIPENCPLLNGST